MQVLRIVWSRAHSRLFAAEGPCHSEARVSNDPLLAETVGAQLIVRVAARAIFPNCPRYIPAMQMTEPSAYTPQAGCDAPEPKWKEFSDFKDYVHADLQGLS
ncbi:hypothetical protein Q2941_39930 [Bradyrhizobium sp. UFLA05-153]